jgi:hypothetical protein
MNNEHFKMYKRGLCCCNGLATKATKKHVDRMFVYLVFLLVLREHCGYKYLMRL